MRIITLGLALGLPAGLYSSFSAAALQPISEAPLAVNTAISCQHNKDNSLDCVTSKRFTILHPPAANNCRASTSPTRPKTACKWSGRK